MASKEPVIPFVKITHDNNRYLNGLSGTSIQVLFELELYTGNKNTCFPHQETLAKSLDKSEKSIRVAIKNLEALGFISISHKGKHSTTYTMLKRLNMKDSDRNKTTGADRNEPTGTDRNKTTGAIEEESVEVDSFEVEKLKQKDSQNHIETEQPHCENLIDSSKPEVKVKRIGVADVRKPEQDKEKETLAPTCHTDPSTHVPSKLTKDSLSYLNFKTKAKKPVSKKILELEQSINYPTSEKLIDHYCDSIPNMFKDRKTPECRRRASRHLTGRLDQGEDIARFEEAIENAIKAQNVDGFESKYIYGPCNMFSTRPTGGKFLRFLPKEQEDFYASVFDNLKMGGEDDDN